MSRETNPLNPGHAPVRKHIAFAYIKFLFVVELILFAASVCLHVLTMIVGMNAAFQHYGLPLFRGAIVMSIPTVALTKDGMWQDQIRRCPIWMWKSALGIGLYSLFIACVQVIFAGNASFSEQTLAISGFPLGFEAISLCVIYSVLWSDYLQDTDIVQLATHSALFLILGTIALWAYRGGYLHRLARLSTSLHG